MDDNKIRTPMQKMKTPLKNEKGDTGKNHRRMSTPKKLMSAKKQNLLISTLILVIIIQIVFILFSFTLGDAIVLKKGPNFLKLLAIEKMRENKISVDTTFLIFSLKNSSPKVREAAARALGEIKPKKAFRPLTELLAKETDNSVVATVFLVIIKIMAKHSSILSESETDSDREYYIKSLFEQVRKNEHRNNDSGFIEAILEGLDDEDRRIQEISAYMCSMFKDARLVDKLIEMTDNKNLNIRKYALYTIIGAKDERTKKLLIKATKDNDKELRLFAIHNLLEFDDPELVNVFIEALNDSEPRIQEYALAGLGKIGDETVVLALKEAVSNKSGQKQLKALSGLVSINSEETTTIIIDAVGSDDKGLRLNAITVLKEVSDDRCIKPLIKCLGDEDPDIRKTTASVLQWKTDDMRVIEALIDALGDSDDGVRVEAIGAVSKIRDKRVVTALIRMLNDENMDIRNAAFKLLANLEDDKAIMAVKKYSTKYNDSNSSETIYPSRRERKDKWEKTKEAFLNNLTEAPVELYGEWMKDWILQGRGFFCGSSRYEKAKIDTVYAIEDGTVIISFSRREKKVLIAPKGIKFSILNVDNSRLLYWDNNGRACTIGDDSYGLMNSDVKEYLKCLNIPEIDKAVKRCEEQEKK